MSQRLQLPTTWSGGTADGGSLVEAEWEGVALPRFLDVSGAVGVDFLQTRVPAVGEGTVPGPAPFPGHLLRRRGEAAQVRSRGSYVFEMLKLSLKHIYIFFFSTVSKRGSTRHKWKVGIFVQP